MALSLPAFFMTQISHFHSPNDHLAHRAPTPPWPAVAPAASRCAAARRRRRRGTTPRPRARLHLGTDDHYLWYLLWWPLISSLSWYHHDYLAFRNCETSGVWNCRQKRCFRWLQKLDEIRRPTIKIYSLKLGGLRPTKSKMVVLRVDQPIQTANLGFCTIIRNKQNWGF